MNAVKSTASSDGLSAKRRPNILLIMTDQQRADTIHALGNDIIKTPVLDKLVAEGSVFTSAYSPSPVCVPARCSMHYGQYPGKTKCYLNPSSMPVDPHAKSFMQLLTEKGYRTHGIGKCHFKPDSQALRGFQTRNRQEEVVQHIEDDDYIMFLQNSPYKYVRDPQGTRAEMIYMPQTSQLPEKYHPTTWVADRSIKFISDEAKKDEPWFLFTSFIHPHPPYAPPTPWDKLYRSPDMPLPYLPKGYKSRQPTFNSWSLYHYHLEDFINLPLWQAMKAHYYSCVSFVDYNIGRILDTLKATEQLDNTLIIFTSDHGEMLGDLGLIGKGIMNESSSHIPLIMAWAGKVPADRRVDTPVTLVDIAPTILEVAGIPPPADMDGKSLLHKIAPGRIIISQVGNGGDGEYMALDDGFKYVHSTFDNKTYLYDRKNDLSEDCNLIDDPKYGGLCERLKKALIEYFALTGQNDIYDAVAERWKIWDHSDRKHGEHRNMRDNPWANYSIPGYTFPKTER